MDAYTYYVSRIATIQTVHLYGSVLSTSSAHKRTLRNLSHRPVCLQSVVGSSWRRRRSESRKRMESVLSPVGAGFCHGITSVNGLGESRRGIRASHFNSCSFGGVDVRRPRRMVLVKAEAAGINPDIRKNEDKVVDSVVVAELAKPLTAYCRCWRSGTFPLCDGSHVKHNKATGDNVGPLLVKK
ncbi:hypothetical protein L6164_006191 [Bauhinia variegata]|uniref:Uncharacterized protein n=1 Tax=Bauhinia variegata TaxID=167791 RepID=A0ACB9PWB9_BAUVA|nr:hypothetical protein L6164_006191 [Bauhinia variegata]